MTETSHVLVVDDQPANLEVLTRVLSAEGWKVRATTSGERALEAARLRAPDCILLDVAMPGMDGYATCRALQQDPTLTRVPVIFITAYDGPEHRVRAFAEGGRDYISKPFEDAEVVARVGNQLRIAALERELRSRNEQLEQVAELKERATAMLVHDIRNPLMVMAAALDVPGEDALGDARQALTKTTRLLDELLEVYRTSHERRDAARDMVDLAELAAATAGLIGPAAQRRGITVRVVGHRGARVLGSAAQLDRVLTNLLDNALKHTEPGGTVTIKTEIEEGQGPESGLRFGVVSVVDSGSGIPAEELAYIFDLYRQRPEGRAKGGVGLGLSIVQRLVASHDGRVHVRSQVGVGSEFRVLIPLATD